MKAVLNMWVASAISTLGVSVFFTIQLNSLLKGLLGGGFFFVLVVLPLAIAVFLQRRGSNHD